MKKLLIILLAGIFVVGCSGNDGEENNDSGENDSDQVAENGEEDNEQSEGEDEKKDVYQIGETAQITSSSYGFPYEVTVNDFEVTTEEVEGYSMEDFMMGSAEPGENTRLAVVNVTLKNTDEDSFVPDDTITPYLTGELTNETPKIEVFKEWGEELEVDTEITEDLVFMSDTLYDDGVVYLAFNIQDPNKEVRFELPVPEE